MLSLATSLATLLGMWLVARKDWRGWAVGLANQLLWLALILQTRTYGLLLLNGALVWIYGKALVTWRREARAQAFVPYLHVPDGSSWCA